MELMGQMSLNLTAKVQIIFQNGWIDTCSVWKNLFNTLCVFKNNC